MAINETHTVNLQSSAFQGTGCFYALQAKCLIANSDMLKKNKAAYMVAPSNMHDQKHDESTVGWKDGHTLL